MPDAIILSIVASKSARGAFCPGLAGFCQRSGFKRAIFGSVANEVLRSAAVPVLAIRMPAPVPASAEAAR